MRRCGRAGRQIRFCLFDDKFKCGGSGNLRSFSMNNWRINEDRQIKRSCQNSTLIFHSFEFDSECCQPKPLEKPTTLRLHMRIFPQESKRSATNRKWAQNTKRRIKEKKLRKSHKCYCHNENVENEFSFHSSLKLIRPPLSSNFCSLDWHSWQNNPSVNVFYENVFVCWISIGPINSAAIQWQKKFFHGNYENGAMRARW